MFNKFKFKKAVKKLKRVKLSTFIIFILLSVYSCSNDVELENANIKTQENFVELSIAKEIARVITFETKGNTNASKSITPISITKTVKTIDEIKNEKGKTSFYVINYNEGGFILLSADNRIQPILALSEEGKFTLDVNNNPLGLKFWINDAKKQITEIQNSSLKQSEKVKLVWERIQIIPGTEINSGKFEEPEPGDPGDCNEHSVTYIKEPLLSSKWFQSGGFNDALPYITCSGTNFQVLTGCVPIAMAQVMKYHEYPISYNWSLMPLTYGTTTTANFIEDIHNAIGTVNNQWPEYTCTATNVSSTDVNIGTVLKSQFNYSSASYGNYDRHIVINNISANRPVILRGDDGSVGHMWVCDGYQTYTYYFDNCSSIRYLYFNMNWGWQNGDSNGWFAFDNFNPDIYNFNNDKKMIYNIIP